MQRLSVFVPLKSCIHWTSAKFTQKICTRKDDFLPHCEEPTSGPVQAFAYAEGRNDRTRRDSAACTRRDESGVRGGTKRPYPEGRSVPYPEERSDCTRRDVFGVRGGTKQSVEYGFCGSQSGIRRLQSAGGLRTFWALCGVINGLEMACRASKQALAIVGRLGSWVCLWQFSTFPQFRRRRNL